MKFKPRGTVYIQTKPDLANPSMFLPQAFGQFSIICPTVADYLWAMQNAANSGEEELCWQGKNLSRNKLVCI